jgi:hypothetical protein
MQENAMHEVVDVSCRLTELANRKGFALMAVLLNPIVHSGTAARVMHFLVFVLVFVPCPGVRSCPDVRSTAMHVLALGLSRVTRGGTWGNEPGLVRSVAHYGNELGNWSRYVGFRLAVGQSGR